MDDAVYANLVPESPEDSYSDHDTDNQNMEAVEGLVLSSIGTDSLCTIEDSLSLCNRASSSTHSQQSSGQHGESTIISSNPSEPSECTQPEVNRDAFILSPHPELLINGIQSLSTIETEVFSIERLFRCGTVGERSDDSEGLMSAISSPSSSVSLQVTGTRGSFEKGAFERVAKRLIFDSSMDYIANAWHHDERCENDEILARLLQEEERAFGAHKKSNTRKRTLFGVSAKKIMIFGQVLVGLIAAVAIKHMSKR